MAILPIFTPPAPVLRQKAQPIDAVTDEIRTYFDNMLETMYDDHGIGLAANQVGLLHRIIVIDLQREKDGEEKQIHYMANPEILWSSEETSTYQEGCLSIPGVNADVTRPAQVKVKYLDYDGETQELEADGLLSTCIQHEIDHLNGVLFVDHLSSLKRNMMMRKFKKQAK